MRILTKAICILLIITLSFTVSAFGVSPKNDIGSVHDYREFNNPDIVSGISKNGIKLLISQMDIYRLDEGILQEADISKYDEYDFSYVDYVNNSFVVLGSSYSQEDGVLLSSADGKTWNKQSIGKDVRLEAYQLFNNKHYIIGSSANRSEKQQNNMGNWKKAFISEDGRNWKGYAFNIKGLDESFKIASLSKVIEYKSTLYSVIEIHSFSGNANAASINGSYICTTKDGVNWDRIFKINNSSVVSFERINDSFVIYYWDGTIFTSSDCINWKSSGFIVQDFSAYINSVTRVENEYFCIAKRHGEVDSKLVYLYFSKDGFNWELLSSYEYTFNYVDPLNNRIYSEEGKYYYLLEDGIVYIDNGKVEEFFYTHIDSFERIFNDNSNNFIAIGKSKAIYKSANGYQWINVGQLPDGEVKIIENINGIWLAVLREDNDLMKIYTSKNLVSWSYVSTLPAYKQKSANLQWSAFEVYNEKSPNKDVVCTGVLDIVWNGKEYVLWGINSADDRSMFLVSSDLKSWKYSDAISKYRLYKYRGKDRNIFTTKLYSPAPGKYILTGLYGLLMTSSDLVSWKVETKVRDLVGDIDIGEVIRSGDQYIIPIGNNYLTPLYNENRNLLVTKDFKTFSILKTNIYQSSLEVPGKGPDGKYRVISTSSSDNKCYIYETRDFKTWVKALDKLMPVNKGIGLACENDKAYILFGKQLLIVPKK